MFVIGLIDNLLRPILVGRDTRMPDYLILLSTLGGLAGFGLAGIIIGPIIAAFFLSVWQMAEQEFSAGRRASRSSTDAADRGLSAQTTLSFHVPRRNTDHASTASTDSAIAAAQNTPCGPSASHSASA